ERGDDRRQKIQLGHGRGDSERRRRRLLLSQDDADPQGPRPGRHPGARRARLQDLGPRRLVRGRGPRRGGPPPRRRRRRREGRARGYDLPSPRADPDAHGPLQRVRRTRDGPARPPLPGLGRGHGGGPLPPRRGREARGVVWRAQDAPCRDAHDRTRGVPRRLRHGRRRPGRRAAWHPRHRDDPPRPRPRPRLDRGGRPRLRRGGRARGTAHHNHRHLRRREVRRAHRREGHTRLHLRDPNGHPWQPPRRFQGPDARGQVGTRPQRLRAREDLRLGRHRRRVYPPPQPRLRRLRGRGGHRGCAHDRLLPRHSGGRRRRPLETRQARRPQAPPRTARRGPQGPARVRPRPRGCPRCAPAPTGAISPPARHAHPTPARARPTRHRRVRTPKHRV
ncbi:Nicotinate phosphoribosyltransferase, partial [uncultured Rubrobacteraceae bacterium]